MGVAENIKTYRKRAGISQKELAERTKLSIATIQGYEQHKYLPKAENLRKIASALGVFDHQLDPNMIVTFDSGEDFKKEWNRITQNLNDSNQTLITVEQISEEYNDAKFLNSFNKLNALGKQKAIEQVEILAKIPEYRND